MTTLLNPRLPRTRLTHAIGIRWLPGWNDVPPSTEIQRAPDDAASPGTPDVSEVETLAFNGPANSDYLDRLPDDGARRHYRIRHVARGLTSSEWTGWVSAIPGYVGAAQLVALDPILVPSGTVVADDGVYRELPRNPILAVDASGNTLLEDGDAVVFTGFVNPPRSWALPQTVSVWESTLSTGVNTSLRVELVNVTATGADVVAKLQQPGATTDRDDGFSGAAITTVGGTTDSDALTIALLPAVNDAFVVRGSVEFTNNSTKSTYTGQLVLKVYSYDAGGAGYTVRDTFTVTIDAIVPLAVESEAFARTVIAPDVDGDTGDKFRIEVYADQSASSSISFSVTGKSAAGYTTNGVAWQTASVTEVAATSAARGSYVSFLLMDRDTA